MDTGYVDHEVFIDAGSDVEEGEALDISLVSDEGLTNYTEDEMAFLTTNTCIVKLLVSDQIIMDTGYVDHEVFIDAGSDVEEGEALDISMVSDEGLTNYTEDEMAFLNSLSADQKLHLGAIDSANDEALTNMVSTNFKWNKDPNLFLGTRESFNEQGGPTFNAKDLSSPLDAFLKMVEPEFVDLIVEETNKYAHETICFLKRNEKLGPKSRLHKWEPTNRWELYKFIGLLICQGLFPNPVETGYWSGLGRMEIFQTMKYDRFLLLKKFLHFADNSNITDDMTKVQRRLFKIKPVVDYFNGQFSKLFYPFQDVSLDESLLKWKGPLSFTQKIETKAAQVGIKTYELCDSKSGYLWKFLMYAGSSEDKEPSSMSQNDPRPSNATAKTVIHLAEGLFHNGHTIVMDNFYNSPLLARYLKSMGVDCYGTLRINRQFVPDSMKSLGKSSLIPGDMVSSNTEDVAIVVWRDANIVVAMISTYHKPTVGHKCKNGKTKFKPAVVLDYNKTMGGVDRKDQLLSAQPMERCRNLVWYKKVFRRLLNVAVLNSHIIYQTKAPKITHRAYREQLVLGILERCSKELSQPAPDVLALVPFKRGKQTHKRTLLKHRHFPIHASTKYSRCIWCRDAKSGKSTRTAFKCEACDVSLCLKKCFADYHTSCR